MMDSPFRYPGSKARLLGELSQHLDPLLEKQKSFCDVFVGGGSVALYVANKYPDVKIYLNDLDDWIFDFWNIVANYPKDLESLLTKLDTQPTIKLFYELSASHSLTSVDRAYRAIFFNRCCFSGIVKRDGQEVKSSPLGGKEQNSKYPIDCRYNSKKLKQKISACHRVLKDRTIVYNQDVNDLLASKLDAVLYLDPPYRKVGKDLYNSFMIDSQHLKMRDALQLQDSWVLSYDDDKVIRELYKDNKIIDLAARYSITGKKNKWQKKNELIILKQ